MIPRTQTVPDWRDVARRAELIHASSSNARQGGSFAIPFRALAPRPFRRRKWLAIAVLLATVIVLLAGPALGIGPPFLDFFSSKHAPGPVVRSFAVLNVGAPRGMSPKVIAGQTRLVTTYRLGDGKPFPLWVAPTRTGGFCFRFGYGGGCADRSVSSHDGNGDRNEGAIGLGRFGSHILAGEVFDKRITKLEVRFKNAAAVSVPLLWVSPPIDAGFFLYDLSRTQRQPGAGPVAVVALDAQGQEIARNVSMFQPRPAWSDPRKVADLSKRHVILRSGRLSIAIAPSRTGGNCFWMKVDVYQTISTGCAPPRYLTMPMAGGLGHGTGFTGFSAQVKPSVNRVELRFQDRTRIVLQPVEGHVLYDIPAAHWPRGHRLVAAVAYATSGKRLASQTFDPEQVGAYPCSKPVPVGAGSSACP
jgi:hypothetical protein